MRKIRTNNKPSTIDELFKTFMSIKKAEGRALNMLQQYRNNFGYFLDYLKKQGIERSLAVIDQNLLRQYISFMQDDWIQCK